MLVLEFEQQQRVHSLVGESRDRDALWSRRFSLASHSFGIVVVDTTRGGLV